MLKKIISGGQDGVDLYALRVAKDEGFLTGGFMPKGFLTISGSKPEYANLYGMVETDHAEYPERTWLNIQNSDATMILTRGMTTGTKAALLSCKYNIKPYLQIDIKELYWTDAAKVAHWLNQYEVVNVAGNRDADKIITMGFLTAVLEEVRRLQEMPADA